MSDIDFICPTCKRPAHPTDNKIIEYLVKEKDRYRDILGKRTKELIRTRKALDVAVDALREITNNDYDADWQNDFAQATLEKIKDIK